MKHVKRLSDFIVESEDSSNSTILSTQELNELKNFKKIKVLFNTLDMPVSWNTGARAYANGTRKLTVGDTSFDFYPKNGTIALGAHTFKRDLLLNSIDSWNDALLSVFIKLISDEFRPKYRSIDPATYTKRVRKAVVEKDIKFFMEEYNKHNIVMLKYRLDELPKSYIRTLTMLIADDPEMDIVIDALTSDLI